MPLLIAGKTIKLAQDVLKNVFGPGAIKTASQHVLGQEIRSVSAKGLLYINQREFAATHPADEQIDILGSEDATTCHIVVLRHTGSGAACLGHCDGCDMENGVRNMITAVQKLSLGKPDGRIELHLAGGFLDPRGESKRLSKEIIKIFIEQDVEVHLITAAISDLNDIVKNSVHFPIIYGVGVDVKTGEVFKATFPDKGPAMDVRSACHFAGCNKLLNVYDYERNQLIVGPYRWDPWPQVEQWLNVPNAFIRRYLSTSPEQEPEDFEEHVRAALRVIFDHPKPHETLFPDDLSWRYTKHSDGTWKK